MIDSNKPTIEMNVSFDHELHKKNEPVYTPAKVVTTQKTEFLCMKCSDPIGSFDHLRQDQLAGPWYCEKCGTGHYIKRTEEGVSVSESTDRLVKTLVLLKLMEPTKKPIHIVVESHMHVPVGKLASEIIGDQQGRDKYHFNEHTCPSNYLGARIAVNGDTDPHGVFRHVQTVIKPEDTVGNGRMKTMGGWIFPDNYLAWMDIFATLQ